MTTEQKLRDYLKRATADLRQARRRVLELEGRDGEPVAIVGMACRFPGGVRTPEDLWDLVLAGRDAISAFPADRGWDLAALQHPDSSRAGASYVRAGGFLYDVPDFDAGFFGISPREAAAMDPQQRLLLETSWEAFERAGIAPHTMRGEQVGVFVGSLTPDYGPPAHRAPGEYEGYLLTGTQTSVASGRIAYTLGLEGPAVTIDTACSSSLSALHLGVQSVRRGECTMALAGGVTVMSQPGIFVDLGRQHGLAPDGRCKGFSAAADGFGPAEGVGLVLIERLADAQRLGHPVLAVVRGSAVNQDGASNGLSAPSGPAQQRVIRAALANAQLTADQVDAVEAHGTGTQLGDPIEAQALGATYGRSRPADRPLLLGTVKSNIGHTAAAAGVAGIIKMVLAMQHGVLPRTLHVDEPTPYVDWADGGLALLSDTTQWPETGRPRRAGVSSFGISGTNAHVILEQAPQPGAHAASEDDSQATDEAEATSGDAAVSAGSETAAASVPFERISVTPWVVTGRGEAALQAQIARLGRFAEATPQVDALSLGAGLARSRSMLENRAVVLGADRAELAAGLAETAGGEGLIGRARADDGGAVFVFPGQGSQWVGMATELLATSPVFRSSIEDCERALAPFVDWSLSAVLAGDGSELERVDVVQPVLFAVMVSLAAVWRALGVEPAAVVGHSQGEIAAACVAGVLTLDDAARVVALRSKEIARIAGSGGMVSLFASRERAEELLTGFEGRVGIAAVNGPGSVVVSGLAAALDEFVALCGERGVDARRVNVDYASHSAQMEELKAEVLAALAPIRPTAPEIPMFSTYTASWVEAGQLGASYWYENLRHPVRLYDAVQELARAGHRVFIESSPHPVLTVGVQDTLDETGGGIALGTLRRDHGDPRWFLSSAAQAFVNGAPVDWTVLFADVPADLHLDLPTYAFQRERFWLEATADAAAPTATAADPADEEFWAAIDSGDLSTLSDALGVEGDRPASDLLPALADWRRGRRDSSILDSWRYKVVWQPVSGADDARLTGTWLLVAPAAPEQHDFAAAVAATLTAAGAEVRTVEAGDAALDRAALAALLTEAAADQASISGVLSLLPLDAAPVEPTPHLLTGVAATLVLIQALGDARIEAPLWNITRGAVTTNAADTLANPLQQQVWGLGRTAALEHPDRWGGLVDLSADSYDAKAALRLRAVLAGLPGDEDQIAIREAGLLVRRVERALLGATAPKRTWRPQGTVLVTGGTGAIGPHLARWLAEGGAQRLVLTSRRPVDTPEFAELRTEIAALGTELVLATCDVGDREQLAALIREVEADGPEIRAVVHAAALIKLGPLDGVSIEEFADTMAAKAATADYLDELLDRDSVDAFVLFSSVAGMWGSGDHGTYAAGNGYLDAVAARRRARGLSAISIAWGVWDGCTPAGVDGDRPARHGLPTIAPRLALLGMQQALDHDEAAVALVEVDWPVFAPIFASGRPSPLLSTIPDARAALAAAEARSGASLQPAVAAASAGATGATRSELAQRLAGLSEAEQEAAILDLVLREAASVLGHRGTDGVQEDRAFRDTGVDSLTSVELRNRLAAATGLKLPAALVFNHPTPRVLARYLRTRLAGSTAGAAQASAIMTVGTTDEPMAIVGMACRFPGGVRSPEDLWTLVSGGTDAVGPLPADRGWDLDALYDPDPDRDGTSYVRHGGFLDAAGEFDASFFGISPREALAMDPQQRLLLETSWEAIERAGIDPAALRGGATGVFIGINYQEYGTGLRTLPQGSEGHLLTGSVASVASGRIAYTLGLEGPAITLDTACSSSLVALHLAAQAIRRGECTSALVGGVAVMYAPRTFIAFSRQRGLAKDGRCKAFAAGADGMGLAEGVGILMVERLSEARRLGHRVLAVVRGSAVNQDGASNGLSAPSGPAQERVIRAALAAAGLTTHEVDAVEAHGTGTTLGDPIEAEALLATYGQGRPAQQPLWLGSVKSNIGHTQAASGVAGVIKMVMAMRSGVLPKTLHVDEPSQHVDWTAGAVELLTEDVAWPQTGRARRAAISSFGISGTNAHVIVEQADEYEAEQAAESTSADKAGAGAPVDSPIVPWIISGKGTRAVARQAERLAEFAETADTGLDVAAVGAGLLRHRALFDDRAVVLGADPGQFAAGLRALAASNDTDGVVLGRVLGSSAVFVFPGQGSQWVGMATDLMATSPAFRSSIEACECALAPFVDWSLTAVLSGDGTEFERVDIVQPVLFAVMVSLAAVWRSLGVEPAAVVGHSQGEIAAACVAGALSLDDAARVVALRSKEIARIAGTGGMVSLFASRERAEELLAGFEGRVGIAAVNGPGSVVVSGLAAALDEFVALCGERGVDARRVNVDYASHSAQMEDLKTEVLEALAPIVPGTPQIPMFSTYTASWVQPGQLGASYWYENLRHPVRMYEAIEALAQAGYRIFIESSAHPVLTVGVQDALDNAGGGIALGTLRRDRGDAHRLLTSAAQAFAHGVPVDFARLLSRVPAVPQPDLPTYAFLPERYWLLDAADPDAAPSARRASASEDEEFWRTVEEGDLAGLAAALGVDGDRPLRDVLPALGSWRRERRETAAVADWRYRITWKPIADPANARLGGSAWLVIASADATDTARACAESLVHAGARVIEHEIAVATAAKDELAEQITRIAADSGPIAGVLSFLALDPAYDEQLRAPHSLAATLALVQALGAASVNAPLWLATQGAVRADDADGPADTGQAQIWGLGRVVGLEHSERWGGLVDLPADGSGKSGDEPGELDARTASRLIATLAGLPGDEDQIALRGAGILARRLVRAPATPGDRAGWRPRGTVLVTGGTGAIGGHVARWLADRGARYLVLASRRGADAPGADELRADLEARGAQVAIEACDVTDPRDLAALASRTEGLAGEPIRAVFHAAGVGWTATLDETDRDLLANSNQVKVAGTRALESVFGDRVDAFVLFSSNAAVWGSTGLGAYCAANAYLDAFAENRRLRGLAATSVAWGLWAGEGMAQGRPTELMIRRGLRPMEPDRAVRVLSQALDNDEALLCVADLDWPRFHAAFASTRSRPLVADIEEVRQIVSAGAAAEGGADAEQDASAAWVARVSAAPPAERVRALIAMIRTHAAAVLRFESADEVRPERAFRELGFDSLTAVEVRGRIAKATGLRLPATLIFDYPTPETLADHLATLLFPGGDTPGTGTAPEDAAAETRIRGLLATIPLRRLREAGIEDVLLGLAGPEAGGSGPGAGEPAEPAALSDAQIDGLDAESLIRLALSGDDT